MPDLILNTAFLKNAITDELTSVASSATVCLSSSSVPFTDTTTLSGARAGEASYPGYAEQLWPLTPIGGGGDTYAVNPWTVVFSGPTSGGVVVIYGAFVEYTTPADVVALMGCLNFGGAQSMSVGGPGLALSLSLVDFDAG